MTWLVEDPLPILLGGMLVASLLAVALVQTGRRGLLLAVVATLLVTAGLLMMERLVVTPREEVEATLEAIRSALEADDLPAVLALVSDEADALRTEIERRLPHVEIRTARIRQLEVTVNELTVPASATARFVGRAEADAKRTDFRHGQIVLRFTARLQREEDGWRILEARRENLY